ncbi:MAG: hypothetical protein WCO84_04320 [bacterium]
MKDLKNWFLLSLLVSFVFLPGLTFANNFSDVCPFVWSKNLKIGSVGEDVLKLQRFLNSDASTMIAMVGPGSFGNELNIYGNLTKRAVVRFQEKYAKDILSPFGLLKGTGSVGVSTRAKLNELCSVAVSLTTVSNISPVEQNILTVTKSEQPETMLAPASAIGVPFTVATLTAGSEDVVINNVTVDRVGLYV